MTVRRLRSARRLVRALPAVALLLALAPTAARAAPASVPTHQDAGAGDPARRAGSAYASPWGSAHVRAGGATGE